MHVLITYLNPLIIPTEKMADDNLLYRLEISLDEGRTATPVGVEVQGLEVFAYRYLRKKCLFPEDILESTWESYSDVTAAVAEHYRRFADKLGITYSVDWPMNRLYDIILMFDNPDRAYDYVLEAQRAFPNHVFVIDPFANPTADLKFVKRI